MSGDLAKAPSEEDIAIEEGEPESLSPATHPEVAPIPDPDPPARKRDTGRRIRGRMTLRIPDDEVARPSAAATPPPPPPPSSLDDATLPERRVSTRAGAPQVSAYTTPSPAVRDDRFEPSNSGPAVVTSRIISVNPAPPDETDGVPEPSFLAPLPPRTLQDLANSEAFGAESTRDPQPGAELLAKPSLGLEVTRRGEHETDEIAAEPPKSGGALSSPDIVIEEDIPPETIPPPAESLEPADVEEAAASSPDGPVTPRSPPPKAASSVETMLDAEEVGLKSEPPPRSSEPGDLAEVSPEDFVSIESVPARAIAKVQAPPPPVSSPKSLVATGPNPAAAKALGSTGPNPAVPPATPSKPPAAPPVPPPPAKPPLMLVPGSASPLAPPPMSEAAATRKRARPWWEELFGDDFIRTMAKISDAQIATEIDFIEESLGLAKGAVVLDLACGTGRHAIEMTSRGYQVVGFDLSLAMLARAADEAQERDQKINFVQGDMREMTFEETFDGIYVWNTSFGFFEEEKNAAVVANLRKALKAGGLLLLDVINRDYLAKQAPSLAWFEGDGCVCMDEMHIDWITSRMRVKRTMMLDDGRTKETDYSIRVYSLHELGKVLHDNGFRVTEVSGRVSTPGVFFGADSPRILVVAEKR
jgi:SAM-dependent methyltransferase